MYNIILISIILYAFIQYDKLFFVICQVGYNKIMNIRAQINYWLALKQYDYRKLADEMSKLSGRKYTRGSINGKLVRNTLTVQELELIAKILGYKIEFKEL